MERYNNNGQRQSNRNYALHITKSAWEDIVSVVESNARMKEANEMEKLRKKAMKMEHEAMVENWENSIKNIIRNIQKKRLQKQEKRKTDKLHQYFVLRKEQESIRKKYINEMQEAIFRSKGFPHQLNRALLLSEIFYERDKQKEFNDKLKQEEKEERIEQAKETLRNAKKEMEEELQKRNKQREDKMKNRELYLKHIQEKERSKLEDKLRKKKEIINTIKVAEELRKIDTEEKSKIGQQKKNLKATIDEFLKKSEEHKQAEAQAQKEQEIIREIYADARYKIESLKNKKETELQEAAIKRRIAMSEMLMEQQKGKEKEEKKQMENAIEEKQKMEQKQFLRKQNRIRTLRKQRIEDRNNAIEHKEQQRIRENELKKWEILNTLETNKYTKQYNQKRRQELWREILNYRRILLEQMAEAERKRKTDKVKEIEWFNENLRITYDDRKFFKYAQEVLELARSKGRSTYPIEKVIEAYKKELKLSHALPERTK